MRCPDHAPPDGPSITLAILAAFGVPLAGLLAGALGGKSFLFPTLSEDIAAVIGGAAGLLVGLAVGWGWHRLASPRRPDGPLLDTAAPCPTSDIQEGP